jgi:hypothetical protein
MHAHACHNVGYADVRQKLARKGVSIGMVDSLIAGIALVNNLPVLTRNRKHFENVEGLRLVPVAQSPNERFPHVYITFRSPFTIRPTVNAFSPARSSRV